jgi:hypothetical protein
MNFAHTNLQQLSGRSGQHYELCTHEQQRLGGQWALGGMTDDSLALLPPFHLLRTSTLEQCASL